MAGTLAMTDKQHCPVGVSILDVDGQPFAELPSGMSVAFASDNPAVADVVAAADGMNADVTSGTVGSATLTATVTFDGGDTKTDTIPVTVTNSAPGAVNFTAGTPVDE